jgi:hypothetical protein
MKLTKYRLIVAAVALSVGPAAIMAERAPAPGSAQDAAAVATPHTPDGHPDLSGVWNGRGGGPAGGGGLAAGPGAPPIDAAAVGAALGAKGIAPLIIGARVDERSTGYENLERDAALRLRLRTNKPFYKPQYWETVRNLDHNSNEDDPGFHCMPAGVPRTGAPAKIVQTADELILLHPGQGGAIAVVDTYRVVPIDGRPHKPLEETDGTWNGDSVGHWEGDTMVIDTVNFVTSTWLAQGGYFHSENMHVIERLHRDGNTLTWQATVEDPDVLLKPWVMDMVTRRLNPDPKALLPETLACSERDAAHSATKDHH